MTLLTAAIAVLSPTLPPTLDARPGSTQSPAPPVLGEGTGRFRFDTGRAGAAPIEVAFYRPPTFHTDSPILIVVPGAGRNADDYRDSWLESARRHGVLVLAPEYPDPPYDVAGYHFGGIIRNLELRNATIAPGTQVYRLSDEDILFDPNTERSTWLFGDFDRLFATVAAAVGSRQTGYDLFGHSAGGQILHRLALFHPDSRARRILAANSGFYTYPRLDVPLPFGLADAGLTPNDLEQALAMPLVLFLGERDDEHETRGTHLRTPAADGWGIGRLARGRRFYEEGRRIAGELGVPFAWQLEVVPDVGHDYRRMGEAAASHLYGERTAD